MKTTVELPDDLMRAVKIRSVEEGRRLKETMADLLRRGLAAGNDDAAPRERVPRRANLPLVHCTHPASDGEEMTPERVAAVLADEEAGSILT